MKLYYSPTSPYVRKVTITAIESGVESRIERVSTNIMEPDAQFLADNPLSKVPTMVTDDGLVLYDSPVICEYLDNMHAGERLFPPASRARWQALQRQALSDGILDAAVLCRLETFLRPEAHRWQPWIDRHWSKVLRGLDVLEADAAALAIEPLTIGHIAAVCALGFLDFRCSEYSWRAGRPLLDAWFQTMMQRASIVATRPVETPPQS